MTQVQVGYPVGMPPTSVETATTVLDGRTARWQGHRDRRRAQFVDTAVQVIAEHGPQASVEQVARAAGVTRQVLYRQFDGRDDLDTAIVDRASTMVLQHLLEHLDASDGVEACLRRLLDAYLNFVDEHESLYWFARTREAQAGPRATLSQTKDDMALVAAVVGEELMTEAGVTTDISLTDIFAVGLIGMADAVISRWLTDPARPSRERLADGLVPLMVAAIEVVIPPQPGRDAVRPPT